MAGFLTLLQIEEIEGDDRRFRLLAPCPYHLKTPDGDEWVDVPKGFITDFGSIPQVFWNIPGLSPFGHYRRAYAVHDKLFVAPVIRTATGVRICSFSEANRILREAMCVLDDAIACSNVFTRLGRKTTRGLVWSQVQTWGKLVWNHHRSRDKDITKENQ